MNIVERLSQGGLIFDGAMGSYLIAQGLPSGQAPELWNLQRPQLVQQVHATYYQAGADIVQTNTFGASPIRLAANGLTGQAAQINTRAVELLQAVKPADKWMAGNIGPSGELLTPTGSLTIAAAEQNFAEQAGYLVAAGVDLINIETMSDLAEALAAVRAVKSQADILVCASLTFEQKRKGFFTIMGNTVEQAVRELQAAGADVLGANCSLVPHQMIDLMKIFRDYTDRPLIAQPNAGQPQIQDNRIVYDLEPAAFAQAALELFELGVTIVGGCCGTTGAHIQALANQMR